MISRILLAMVLILGSSLAMAAAVNSFGGTGRLPIYTQAGHDS